jgi:hypothetical protein
MSVGPRPPGKTAGQSVVAIRRAIVATVGHDRP